MKITVKIILISFDTILKRIASVYYASSSVWMFWFHHMMVNIWALPFCSHSPNIYARQSSRSLGYISEQKQPKTSNQKHLPCGEKKRIYLVRAEIGHTIGSNLYYFNRSWGWTFIKVFIYNFHSFVCEFSSHIFWSQSLEILWPWSLIDLNKSL